MFQNFPYTDMHQLNLDWIIKIAKDFLDQYTHIQQLIADGEESLNNLTAEGIAELEEKATALNAALQALYDGLSSDLSGEYTDYHNQLANQLTSALADMATALQNAQTEIGSSLNSALSTFNNAANAKKEEVLESIPEDYSALSTAITQINNNIENTAITFDQFTEDLRTNIGYFIDENGQPYQYTGWSYSYPIPIEKGDIIAYAWGSPAPYAPSLILYDKEMNFFKAVNNPVNTTYGPDSYTIQDEQVKYFIYNITNPSYCSLADQYLRITKNILHFNKQIYSKYNYFNEKQLDVGFIQEDGIRNTSFQTWRTTQYIPVKTGDVVSYKYGSPDTTGQAPALTLYDENKTFIGCVKNRTISGYGADTYIIVDPDVKYIIYNICPVDFVVYADQYLYIESKIPYSNNIHLYVGSNRDGENCFKTIKAVTEYIENNAIFNAIVHLDDETFRIDNELGADFLASYSYSTLPHYSGPKFMNNTHYIGQRNTRIYFWYNGNNTQVNEYISPVNIAGDCILENIKIDCAGGRYCVHDDIPTSGQAGTKYTVQIINCDMRHFGNIAEATNPPICIGGGCNNSTTHIIIGGQFIVDSANASMSIAYHPYNMSIYGQGDSKVIIKDVWTNKNIEFPDFGNSNMLVFVSGCKCNDITSTIPSSRLTLREWNNSTT